MEALEKIAYEAGLRTLDKQEEVVRELRSRTALVLAAASFAISIGGGPALRSSPGTVAIAVGAAMVALGASLYVALLLVALRDTL